VGEHEVRRWVQMSGWENRPVEELVRFTEPEYVTIQERVPRREMFGRVPLSVEEIQRSTYPWWRAQSGDTSGGRITAEMLRGFAETQLTPTPPQQEYIQYIPYRGQRFSWFTKMYGLEEPIHPDLRVEEGL
jgi:hypothetical protein